MDKPAALYTNDKARTISGIRQCTCNSITTIQTQNVA